MLFHRPDVSIPVFAYFHYLLFILFGSAIQTKITRNELGAFQKPPHQERKWSQKHGSLFIDYKSDLL
jgi:hypothetical protein